MPRCNVGGTAALRVLITLRLTDSMRFNVIPSASADALLSAAPVAAFGFIGSNPGAITVQGSQLTVAEGTGISLIGGILISSGLHPHGPQRSDQPWSAWAARPNQM